MAYVTLPTTTPRWRSVSVEQEPGPDRFFPSEEWRPISPGPASAFTSARTTSMRAASRDSAPASQHSELVPYLKSQRIIFRSIISSRITDEERRGPILQEMIEMFDVFE